MKEIKRGEIYSADFGAGFGSEQGGIRPILILQNNTGISIAPPLSWQQSQAERQKQLCLPM